MHDSLSMVIRLGHSHLRNFHFRAYTSNYARVLRCKGETAMMLRQMNNKYYSIAFRALYFWLFIFWHLLLCCIIFTSFVKEYFVLYSLALKYNCSIKKKNYDMILKYQFIVYYNPNPITSTFIFLPEVTCIICIC